jgi:uncharacterized membrane protein YeaQ/YmgE (transglycosylase-associated protein family)
MKRGVLAAFLVCQLAGEIASWLVSGDFRGGGPWLWVISVILLLPGDVAASWLIERFLWASSLNLHQLQWLKVIGEIIINAAVWMLVAASASRLNRRLNRKPAQ